MENSSINTTNTGGSGYTGPNKKKATSNDPECRLEYVVSNRLSIE